MIVDKSVILHILLRSVFLNGWSLVLTAALTIVIVYLFIVIGYVFFPEDFVGSGPASLPMSLQPCVRAATGGWERVRGDFGWVQSDWRAVTECDWKPFHLEGCLRVLCRLCR